MSIKFHKYLYLTITSSLLIYTSTTAFAQNENFDPNTLNAELAPNDSENLDEANPTNNTLDTTPETLEQIQPDTTTPIPRINELKTTSKPSEVSNAIDENLKNKILTKLNSESFFCPENTLQIEDLEQLPINEQLLLAYQLADYYIANGDYQNAKPFFALTFTASLNPLFKQLNPTTNTPTRTNEISLLNTPPWINIPTPDNNLTNTSNEFTQISSPNPIKLLSYAEIALKNADLDFANYFIIQCVEQLNTLPNLNLQDMNFQNQLLCQAQNFIDYAIAQQIFLTPYFLEQQLKRHFPDTNTNQRLTNKECTKIQSNFPANEQETITTYRSWIIKHFPKITKKKKTKNNNKSDAIWIKSFKKNKKWIPAAYITFSAISTNQPHRAYKISDFLTNNKSINHNTQLYALRSLINASQKPQTFSSNPTTILHYLASRSSSNAYLYAILILPQITDSDTQRKFLELLNTINPNNAPIASTFFLEKNFHLHPNILQNPTSLKKFAHARFQKTTTAMQKYLFFLSLTALYKSTNPSLLNEIHFVLKNATYLELNNIQILTLQTAQIILELLNIDPWNPQKIDKLCTPLLNNYMLQNNHPLTPIVQTTLSNIHIHSQTPTQQLMTVLDNIFAP